MRIGIYGGSFNPVHMGHIEIAKEIKEQLLLDLMLLIPAAVPPHKELPKDSPTPEQRVEMLKLTIDTMGMSDFAAVDDLELKRSGPSYTSDTVRELTKRYPNDELYLLMGSDMLETFLDWHEPEVICSLTKLVVFARSRRDSMDRMREQVREIEKKFYTDVTIAGFSPESSHIVEISSTDLRKALKREDRRPKELPWPVYGYILRHGLYGTDRDLKRLTLDELRICSLSMVYAKRHAHILGVEETAVKLANLWGADPELARRAGILHDCTKYLSLEEHLSICEAAGIVPDELEAQSPKLLHSKTGAAIAKNVYGMPEEVYWAIYWHTTGRPDMTLLEKIIYLADYMEPNRTFDGVSRMRELCFRDLDAALEMGLQMSVDDLTARGVPIHKNTQGALDWVREHRKGS